MCEGLSLPKKRPEETKGLGKFRNKKRPLRPGQSEPGRKQRQLPPDPAEPSRPRYRDQVAFGERWGAAGFGAGE